MAKRSRSGGEAEEAARRIVLLNRWLKAAADILGADSGCIVLSESGIARVVARHNLPHAFLATPVTAESAPYPMDGELLLKDASSRADILAFLGQIAAPRLGMLYRRTLSESPDRRLALVIQGSEPRPGLDDRDVALVREIAGHMAEEAERQFPAAGGGFARSLSMTRAGLAEWLKATDLPAAIFGDDLTLVAANERLMALVPAAWDQLIGRNIADMGLPGGTSLAFMLLHAIDSGVSTPRLELCFDRGPGLEETAAPSGAFAVMGAPVSPIDGADVVIVTVEPLSGAATDALALEPGPEQATVDFLMKTLVRRRALRSRNGVSYLTLRSWRQPIREHQIDAIKALKRHSAASLADGIADEIADDVTSLLGGGFRAVVPMPCGHSAPNNCLSLEVARSLGRRLSLPVATVLRLPPETGGSHPKTNAKRAAMILTGPVDGPVLLVDDVATSGRHVEEAVNLLRGANAPAMAIAWIGGDAAGED
jgi:hypothetical protein